jgi:hypothetical protein
MKRTRTMGLAVALALTLTALVGVGSASAARFIADDYPASFTVDPVGSSHVLSFGATVYGCNPSMTFTGELKEASTTLAPPFQTANVSCKQNGSGKSTPLKTGNCSLVFNPGVKVSEGQFEGSIDIGPPGCGPMLFDGETCDITIASQSDVGSATYHNEYEGNESAIHVDGQFSFDYTKKSGCSSPGTYTDGAYAGEWVVEAMDEISNPIDIEVAQPPIGLFTSAEGFLAEDYPVTVTNKQDASPHVFTRLTRTFSCAVAHFGNVEWSGPTADLFVAVDYEECTSNGVLPATVEMHGCGYEFNITGQAAISCPGESSIEFKVFDGKGKVLCAYQTKSQEGLKGVSYSTNGEGSGRTIDVDASLEGINSKRTGGSGGMLVCGKNEDTLKYTGGSTLSGLG